MLQLCVMEFGSWAYDLSQVDIEWWFSDKFNVSSPFVDFTDYVISNEWVTDAYLEREINPKDRKLQIPSEKHIRNRTLLLGNGRRSDRSYPTLRYKLRMRRNPSFYVSILVLPCILLSSLTLVLFWLPPESPAKMMLGKMELVTGLRFSNSAQYGVKIRKEFISAKNWKSKIILQLHVDWKELQSSIVQRGSTCMNSFEIELSFASRQR